jgi:hypothetical protein
MAQRRTITSRQLIGNMEDFIVPRPYLVAPHFERARGRDVQFHMEAAWCAADWREGERCFRGG